MTGGLGVLISSAGETTVRPSKPWAAQEAALRSATASRPQAIHSVTGALLRGAFRPPAKGPPGKSPAQAPGSTASGAATRPRRPGPSPPTVPFATLSVS